MALAVILEFALEEQVSLKHGVSVGLFGYALVMSASATSIITCLAILMPLVLCRKLWHKGPSAVAASALGALVFCVAAFGFAGEIFEALGRDFTLTGRTALWTFLCDYAAAHPVLGYGYATFWTGAITNSVESRLGWSPGQAHNGYLDLVLQLGLVGAASFLISAVTAGVRLARASHFQAAEGRVGAAIGGFIIVASLTESGLTSQNSILWILYVAVASWAVANSVAPGLPQRRLLPNGVALAPRSGMNLNQVPSSLS
jgi:O-antigen ligase